MTEVPEHLLARSRARRAALGLSGGEAAPAPAEAPTEAEATPATTTAAPAPAAPVAAPAEAPPPPPPPPYVQAGMDRRKIPWWVMPVLGLLPLWAVLYAGTLSKASTGQPTQLEAGATIFANNCATCHGATGGGGVGPALAAGAVLKTFPNRADQLRWVWGGSSGWPASTFGAQNTPVGAGGMPNFNDTLTPEELLSVVRYEREGLSGEQLDPKTETIDPATGRLMIIVNGTPVDAVTYYFGDAALGDTGTYTVKGKDPFINGAKYSASK